MTRMLVLLPEGEVSVAGDDRPLDAMRYRALFRTQVQDELTGQALLVSIQVSVAQPRTTARSMEGGMIGVVGRPWDVANPLFAADLPVDLILNASRYIERRYSERISYRQRHLTTAGSGPVISLDDTANLQPGQALLIGPGAADEVAELARIAALGPGPSDVTLVAPLGGMHAAGSVVVADAFSPGGPPQLVMHRAPLRVTGRVIRRTVSGDTVLAGATVRISKVWQRIPPANAKVDPESPTPGMAPPVGPWPADWAPPLAHVAPPLYRDYPKGSTVTVENRSLDAAVPDKHLLQPAARDDAALRLSDRVGLAANDVIVIDAADPSRREILQVVQVSAAGTEDQPARVSLAYALRHAHREGVLVQKLSAPPGGGAFASLNAEALENDPCVLMDTRSIGPTQQVVIKDPDKPELSACHQLIAYTTQTDANGYYMLPPLSRAGKIEISAEHAGPPATRGSIEFIPDYSQAENRIDLLLS